jgi:hypothetical protein
VRACAEIAACARTHPSNRKPALTSALTAVVTAVVSAVVTVALAAVVCAVGVGWRGWGLGWLRDERWWGTGCGDV